jgi:hypothetical protein
LNTIRTSMRRSSVSSFPEFSKGELMTEITQFVALERFPPDVNRFVAKGIP